MKAGDCVFCEIVRGREPASVVYDDARVLAFLDIRPINPGHLLVVPKTHVAHLVDLGEEDAAGMFTAATRLATALYRCGLRCDGINVFLADREVAEQDILHVHLHVIPRVAGDGVEIVLPPGYGRQPDRAELDAVAARIRAALRGV